MIISKAKVVLIVPAMLAIIIVQQMAVMVQDGHMAVLAIGKIQRRAWTQARVLLAVAVNMATYFLLLII